MYCVHLSARQVLTQGLVGSLKAVSRTVSTFVWTRFHRNGQVVGPMRKSPEMVFPAFREKTCPFTAMIVDDTADVWSSPQTLFCVRRFYSREGTSSSAPGPQSSNQELAVVQKFLEKVYHDFFKQLRASIDRQGGTPTWKRLLALNLSATANRIANLDCVPLRCFA